MRRDNASQAVGAEAAPPAQVDSRVSQSMKPLDRRQQMQECEYDSAYHYIPTWDGRFYSQARVLSWGYRYLSALMFVVDTVTRLGFQSLLDVGCGDGRLLAELKRLFPDRRLVGTDASERALGLAQIMVPDVTWVCGDITAPGMLSELFDVVTVIEVIEHIHPDGVPAFVQGLHQRVRFGGKLVVTVPSIHDKLHPKHYRHFTAELLGDVLDPFFEVVECHHLDHTTTGALRAIEYLFSNHTLTLTNRRILGWLYRIYIQRYLLADAATGRRIAMVCTKRERGAASEHGSRLTVEGTP